MSPDAQVITTLLMDIRGGSAGAGTDALQSQDRANFFAVAAQ